MHKYAVFPLYLMIPPGKIATLKSHLYFFPALLKSPNTDFDNNSAEHPSGKFGLFRNYFSDCFYTYLIYCSFGRILRVFFVAAHISYVGNTKIR